MRKRQNTHKSRSLKPGAACHSATVTLLRSCAARDRSEQSSHSRTHLDSCFHFPAQVSPCSSPNIATLGDFLLLSGFISDYTRILSSITPTHWSFKDACCAVSPPIPQPHLPSCFPVISPCVSCKLETSAFSFSYLF